MSKSSCKVAKWNGAKDLNFTFIRAGGAEDSQMEALSPVPVKGMKK